MTDNNTGLPLTTHLRELRKRLIICFIATAIGFSISYYCSDRLYDILTAPLVPALPPDAGYLVFTGVAEPFFIYFKAGLLGGVVLASPVILYEIWAFAAPGLYAKERVWFAAIVLASLALFAAGVVFAYFIVFPFAFKYLLSFSTAGLRPMISMSGYFSLAAWLLFAFGAVFQLPLAMLVLSMIGVAGARQFIRWWRYAVVVILIAAAVLTPTPDVFNQMLMAGPLIVLYAMGVVLAAIFGKKKDAMEL
ncbi:MAG: twin-arginine translocase subunit TatC [Deltaproteobacteria bacterium]|nr:twin-arginine translocase subunit TatC [Deltaproteobacteria bacterium]